MANTVRGHIEQLPSGSFRVHVYAGTDPVTGRPRRLKETCPDEATAAAALGRLLNEADGGRFPNRAATLGQALDKYLEVTDLEVSTKEAHQGYIRRTIGPVLGNVKVRKLGPDSLDGLYTALKKCSRLCGRLPKVEHHTEGAHACDQRCGPLRDHRTGRPRTCDSRCRLHVCKPMRPATILWIHSIISAALDLAVRYEWTDRNVAKNARPPHPRKREPEPPSPEQAARLLNLVWVEDEEFGLYLWAAFTTGARRGEVTALREKSAEWVKHNLNRVRDSLPNGYCGRPAQQDCPHPNACLTCPDFQTTPQFLQIHRRQAAVNSRLIAQAEGKGQLRLAENLRRVQANLDRIIPALEGLQDDDPRDEPS